MPDCNLHIASTLGMLLGVSLVAGVVAEYLRVPKVTAYLLVGMTLGKSVFDLIPEEHAATFEPLLKLAMALVLFNLGCQFPFQQLKKILGRVWLISVTELSLTFLLVSLGLVVCGQRLDGSILLGTLALATAPATTILVLKELRSQGPVTDYAGVLVALNNLASIVAFEFAFLIIHLLQGRLVTPLSVELGRLAQDLGGSVLAGLVAGIVVSYGVGLMRPSRWLVLLVAVTTFALGICESLEIPYLLTFVVMGLTVANTSDMTEEINRELDHVTGVLSVIFFAVHGSELDAHAFIAAGLGGMAYIVCRFGGKYIGIVLGATLSRQTIVVRTWLAPSLMAQAGVAIALSTVAVHRDAAMGKPIQTIILGSVVIFEIIGPLLTRAALLRSGEVPIEEAILHTSTTPLDHLRAIFNDTLATLQGPRDEDALLAQRTIEELVRKDACSIADSALFADVLASIEDSHDNMFPIVDSQRCLVGIIRYTTLSAIPFDKAVSALVRAEDLATPVEQVLHPDDTVTRAIELFKLETEDCIAVVPREGPARLLGVVRKRDLMHLLIRKYKIKGS